VNIQNKLSIFFVYKPGGIMSKKCYPMIILVLIFSSFLAAKKITTLPDLMKPTTIVIEDDKIYISQKTTVFIFSLVDFQLIKKFGKTGEGPQEFLRFVRVTPHKDQLILNSMGKISIYTKDGKFVKELRTTGGFSLGYLPLGNHYVGMGISLDEDTRYQSINLYDSGLKKLKTLVKKKSDSQPNKGVIKILHSTLTYLTFEDKLYIVDGSDFVVNVYDNNAKELFTIKRDYKKVKFGEKDKQKIFDELKSDPRQKQYFDIIKRMAVFPDYYPAIVTLFERDNNIYLMTFKRIENKYEFFIFDANGNFVKQVFIPFVFRSAMRPYPFSIKDNKLYQLIENEDTEEWELHLSEIK